MLEGINNSGQKRLQIYAPWNGQNGTGSSISAQGTEIGNLLGGVKLPTKEQIEASLKKVQPQNLDEVAQKVHKQFEEQAKKDYEQNIRIMPYVPTLTEPEEKLIDPNSDLGKKIAKALDDLHKNPQLIKNPSLADDYVPVYKPKTGLNGAVGPWAEHELIGYRPKTDDEKKGVELY